VGWGTEERRGERARGSLRKDGITSIQVEGCLGLRLAGAIIGRPALKDEMPSTSAGRGAE
jgi:hypothetical protein